jgi:hypothetical protein
VCGRFEGTHQVDGGHGPVELGVAVTEGRRRGAPRVLVLVQQPGDVIRAAGRRGAGSGKSARRSATETRRSRRREGRLALYARARKRERSAAIGAPTRTLVGRRTRLDSSRRRSTRARRKILRRLEKRRRHGKAECATMRGPRTSTSATPRADRPPGDPPRAYEPRTSPRSFPRSSSPQCVRRPTRPRQPQCLANQKAHRTSPVLSNSRGEVFGAIATSDICTTLHARISKRLYSPE